MNFSNLVATVFFFFFFSIETSFSTNAEKIFHSFDVKKKVKTSSTNKSPEISPKERKKEIILRNSRRERCKHNKNLGRVHSEACENSSRGPIHKNYQGIFRKSLKERRRRRRSKCVGRFSPFFYFLCK